MACLVDAGNVPEFSACQDQVGEAQHSSIDGQVLAFPLLVQSPDLRGARVLGIRQQPLALAGAVRGFEDVPLALAGRAEVQYLPPGVGARRCQLGEWQDVVAEQLERGRGRRRLPAAVAHEDPAVRHES